MANNIETQDPFKALDILKESLSNFSSEDQDPNLPTMSLVDHLQELRSRIFICLIAVVLGAILAFIFRDQVIQFLTAALPTSPSVQDNNTHAQLVTTGLTEGFTIDLVLSLAIGVAVALPVILYQIWGFIAPGLYEHEKKASLPFIFLGVGLFATGVTLAYFMLSYPVMWFEQVASEHFITLVTASSYFHFVTLFFLAFGLVFEIPLVLIFMARVGLISQETLKRRRPMAHFGMWVAATFLTPGADLYSPLILAAVMSILYELSIILIKVLVKETAWRTEEA